MIDIAHRRYREGPGRECWMVADDYRCEPYAGRTFIGKTWA
jgi:hypothetical protein